MKIGIDARFYSPHFGIGRYVYELTRNLFEMDGDNEYVLFLNEPEYHELDLTRFPNSGRLKKIPANAPHYSIREQWNFFRALKKENLNMVHFTHFNAPFLYRLPCVVTIHDLTLSMYPESTHNGLIRRAGYGLTISSIAKRARKIIAVSENTKEDIVRFLRAPDDKISVIYPAVADEFKPVGDEEHLAKFRERMDLTKPYLLYAGVWRSHKNLVNLLRAFAILKNKYKFDGVLAITGKDDPRYPEVKKTVEKLEIGDSVKFVGRVAEEDMPALYSAATAYVLPSYYEGFGLPALEAFACGTPVCASQTSCIPEVCGEDNAQFFDPYDPTDMAAKIARVVDDKELRAKLRELGMARIKDFSWRKMAEQTLEVYKEAAKIK